MQCDRGMCITHTNGVGEDLLGCQRTRRGGPIPHMRGDERDRERGSARYFGIGAIRTEDRAYAQKTAPKKRLETATLETATLETDAIQHPDRDSEESDGPETPGAISLARRMVDETHGCPRVLSPPISYPPPRLEEG